MVDLKLQFPNNFFDEEVRSDFTITKERKEVWAVELDLLSEFDRVCKKYNLKYSLDGGSLLGAIRHKGFIPWDDDIDVIIRRDDYNKLCEVASEEFNDYFFFQTDYTDPGTLRGHAQLRNSNTTGILNWEKPFNLHFNQGIFIDIFPIDNIVDDKEKLKIQIDELNKLLSGFSFYKNYVQCSHKPDNVKKFIKYGVVFFYRFIDKRRFTYEYASMKYKEFERVCSMFNNISSKYMGNLVLNFKNYKRCMQLSSGWDNLEYVNFEFLKVPVVSDYKYYLTNLYGSNYMKPIKEANVHGGVFFDTNNCYKKYIKS